MSCHSGAPAKLRPPTLSTVRPSGPAKALNLASLKGHYDFHLNWVQDPDSKLPPGLVAPHDPDQLSHFDFGALGLRRIPIQLAAETLVIDHIEEPSEN